MVCAGAVLVAVAIVGASMSGAATPSWTTSPPPARGPSFAPSAWPSATPANPTRPTQQPVPVLGSHAPTKGLATTPVPVLGPATRSSANAPSAYPPSAIGQSSSTGPLSVWGAPPAPLVDPRRFAEAHWQGLEVIPKTPALARSLGIPASAEGVIVDDVTLPADLQGFQAGDLVTAVGQVPTPDLMSFVEAADRVRDRRRAEVEILRKKAPQVLVLTALLKRLGTANGETPSMIVPSARMPHSYRGACTSCHRIGTTAQLAQDQGDTLTKTAPPIRANASPPHRDRGPCSTCHQVLP